jgi:RHS repeat-associated protein
VLRYEGITRDLVGNPISIQDFRIAGEWPAGAKPVARDIQYDDLYRVIQVDYNYSEGSDTWVSPHAPELAGSTDPRRPSDFPSQIVRPTRIQQQKFTYDWLGNLSRSSDDLNTLWDRSMGAMRTWTGTSMPYRFRDAGDRADATWPGSDWADAPTYDETGNIGQIRVTRTATCTSGGTACSHTYSYYYDEIGRLYRALRHEGTPQKAELRFVYDANDDRVIKSDVFPAGTVNDRHTLYIFDSLELRRALHDATNLRYAVNSQTEVPYLNANGVRLGRVVYESPTDGEPRLSANPRHVFLNLGDELGSASIIIDKDTGELVERMTYQPYGATESDYRPDRWKGFREDYRFTGKEEDQEVGLTYFGKRFLSAPLGRWVSPDPLAIHLPGSADLNLYAYVVGKVLKAVDPIGLETDENGVRVGATTVHTLEVSSDGSVTYEFKESSTAAKTIPAPASWAPPQLMDAPSPESEDASAEVPERTLEEGLANALLQKITGQDLLMMATDKPPGGWAPLRLFPNGDDALGHVMLDFLASGMAGAAEPVPRMALTYPRLPNPAIVTRSPTLAEGQQVADALAWELQAQLAPLRGGFGKKPAVVIGRFDPAVSEASAFASRPGAHAEIVAEEAMPEGVFSRPISVRRGQYADVCVECEARFGRGPFPTGSTFESDTKF